MYPKLKATGKLTNKPMETFTVKNIITIDSTKCNHILEGVEYMGIKVYGCSHRDNEGIRCSWHNCPLKSKKVILKA